VHAEMAPSQHHGALVELVEQVELLLRLRLFVEPPSKKIMAVEMCSLIAATYASRIR